MYNDEDDENLENFYDFPDREEIKQNMEREAKKNFIAAAYRAYDVLVKDGINAVNTIQKDSAILAIRRILGLMQEREEYERCFFLKTFLEEEMGIEEPHPVFDFNK